MSIGKHSPRFRHGRPGCLTYGGLAFGIAGMVMIAVVMGVSR